MVVARGEGASLGTAILSGWPKTSEKLPGVAPLGGVGSGSPGGSAVPPAGDAEVDAGVAVRALAESLEVRALAASLEGCATVSLLSGVAIFFALRLNLRTRVAV